MNRRLETLLAERQSQLHAQLASPPRPRAKVTCSMLHETERQLLRGRSRAHWMQAQHAPPAEPPPPPLHAARAARPFSAAPPPAAAQGRVRTAAWGHLTAPLPYAHKPRPASALAAHGARPTPAAPPPPAAPQGFRQASPQPSAHAVPQAASSHGFNHPSQASNGFNHPSSQASHGFNHPSSQASNGFNHPSSQASHGFNHPSSQASHGFNHPSQASNGFNHPSSQASHGFNHPPSQASHGLHQGFSQGTSQAASSQSSSHGVPPPSSQASHGFPQGAFSLARPKAGATSSAGAGSGEPSTGRTEGAEAAEGEGAGGEGSEEGAARSGVEGSERRSTASLVQLAVRASSQGGTGVGGGVAQPVGLSELYKLGRSIGEGSFGFVRVAQERISQELVAVKTFEKSRIKDAAARRRIENEIRVLQRMRHPHVVRLFEVFESAQRVHLCMEHVCGGTLYRHLTQHKRLPEPEVRRLLRQLVGAVAYLHHRFIAHRDIKLENVLLDEMKNVKLIDFGFSVLTRTRLKVACGSPAYTAPEILKAHEYDGRLADVWSLGVLTYVMLVGRFPFSGATRKDLSMAIMRGVFPTPSWMTRDPDTLIRRMLVIDPTQRFNIENVRHNAWLAAAGGEHEIVTEHTEARTIEPRVVGSMVSVGFKPEDIEQSVTFDRHDHINTSYLLLAEKRRRLEAASTSGSAAPPAQRSASTPVGSGADPRAPTIKHQPYSAVQGMQRLSIAQRQVATTDVQQTEQVDETRNLDACGGDVHAIG
ncbi:hypothetical protein AB1Y20_005676 [Prymnesium parvum]|uniref:Protein kinase domain-containing protein n=1 Tax=Prymnesium parvum TaxID=97485 RepID=A0AB34J7C5_PRYPA